MILLILGIMCFILTLLCAVLLIAVVIIDHSTDCFGIGAFSIIAGLLSATLGVVMIKDYYNNYIELHNYEIVAIREDELEHSNFDGLDIEIISGECSVFIKESNVLYQVIIPAETFNSIEVGKTYEKTYDWFDNLGTVKDKVLIKE